MFDSEVLMITGGTGSFGNAVLKRFLSTNVREIRIFSRDEKKQEDMRIAFNSDKLRFYIGDVRDYDSVSQAMKGVDYVFHAAFLSLGGKVFCKCGSKSLHQESNHINSLSSSASLPLSLATCVCRTMEPHSASPPMDNKRVASINDKL